MCMEMWLRKWLALLAEQSGDPAQAAAFKQRAARVYQRSQANGRARDGVNDR